MPRVAQKKLTVNTLQTLHAQLNMLAISNPDVVAALAQFITLGAAHLLPQKKAARPRPRKTPR